MDLQGKSMKRLLKSISAIVLQIFIVAIIIPKITNVEASITMNPIAPMWITSHLDSSGKDQADIYIAFRGQFDLSESCEVEFRLLGVSWFNVWLDEEFFAEGPARFHRDYPEYDVVRIKLSAGKHLLAAQVHHVGIETRILDDLSPFFSCHIVKKDEAVPVEWKCTILEGYRSQVRRINPQLGWIEWCDTRKLPDGWKSFNFDDSGWQTPVLCEPEIGVPTPLSIATVKSFIHSVKSIAGGPLAEVCGFENEDVSNRFFLRDLVCDKIPPQGVWRRYDLGRVRLAQPRFILDLSEGGAVVEFAYSEILRHGRVSPYITLSMGPSCNFDHFEARGGRQEFFPMTPKGGRFVEIHVFGETDKIHFNREEFVERGYHDTPEGYFRCNDELLNRIWKTGIETYRACSEDALIDNPTRERGQWTGDAASVGMDNAAVGYSDIRLCSRALVQSAQCAREDGLVAGLCPGGEAYLPTYAAQWISACMHYFELTGENRLLEELFPPAMRNMAAFEKTITKDGLTDGLGWIFIDWGYKRNSGPIDMAYNLHFLAALRDMIRWCKILGKHEHSLRFEGHEKNFHDVILSWFKENIGKGHNSWQQIGYHCAVLGLRLSFFDKQIKKDCIDYIKQHILSCFPNNPDAPRNSIPGLSESRLITPYFAHYVFPPLIENGEMNFILDQYRKCWGWALEDGRTTWVEVFDTRWTHCHQWSGCPTWQLSRYVLGLHPRFDLDKNFYKLSLYTGDLTEASGCLPISNNDGVINVKWQKKDSFVDYHIETSIPIHLILDEKFTSKKTKTVFIKKEFRIALPIQ